jgi:anti-sigma-K factor RskA
MTQGEKIDILLERTARIDERTEHMEKTQEKHESRLNAVESRPAEKWKTVVSTAIATTIATILTYFAQKH